MSRAERLLDLMQCLRRHRAPVSGAQLASELGVSLRTVYRDIASLQSQGAQIDGEAGLGYLLRPGFTLPPLMFSVDELEALALGSRWVADRAQHNDAPLATGALNALAKIAAVLPPALRHELDTSALLVGPGAGNSRSIPMPVAATASEHLPLIRRALRGERKLRIRYCDLQDQSSERTIWPVALGHFDTIRVLVAWCEVREAFRHFRADRIQSLIEMDERMPRRRQALLADWKKVRTSSDRD